MQEFRAFADLVHDVNHADPRTLDNLEAQLSTDQVRRTETTMMPPGRNRLHAR